MHIQNFVLNTALLFTSLQNCLVEAHFGIQGYNMTLSNTAHATLLWHTADRIHLNFITFS